MASSKKIVRDLAASQYRDVGVSITGAARQILRDVVTYVPDGGSSVREYLVHGPRGCVAGETELWDPVAGVGRRIDRLCAEGVRPWVQTLRGPVLAEVPFLKGYADLYRVTTEGGRSIVATGNHQFLTPSGWRFLRDLRVGDEVSCDHERGTELRSVRDVDALRWKRTTLGSRADYPSSLRSCDERPLSLSGTVLESSPSLADVLGRTRDGSPAGDAADGAGYTRACHSCVRPSRPDSACLQSSSAVAECVSGLGTHEPCRGSCQSLTQSRQGSPPQQPCELPSRGDGSTPRIQPDSPCSHYGPFADRVSSVEYERTDFYFDLHVPGPEHYLAHGFVNHNTGKTRGVCLLLRALADMYPGMRALVVRATRRSMSESFCKTMDDVLPLDDPARDGPSPDTRSRYFWPETGSVIALAGLDEPMRLYGTDWDVVVYDEATTPGVSEDAWQQFRGSLRNGKLPLHLAIMLCNPSSPQHWTWKRSKRGVAVALKSEHWHNPRWYDAKAGEWTAEGVGFIGNLRCLSGTAKRRLLDGEWCAAEGAVYASWDTDKHVVSEPPGEPTWYCAGVDWGYASPGSLLVAGVDALGRVTIIREVYRSSEQIDWWAEKAVEIHRRWRLEAFVCDPARPDAIDTFNRELRRKQLAPVARPADNKRASSSKGDLAGIDLVRHYLDTGRLYVLDDARRMEWGIDTALVDLRVPTSLTEEIPDYVYRPSTRQELDSGKIIDRTDEKCADHALDALRYLIAFVHGRDLSQPTKWELPNGAPAWDAEDLDLLGRNRGWC